MFALCTVASTAAIRWVVDRAILPRFDKGQVGTATALAGLGAIIAIGFVRAAGVIVRRSWAGRAHRRIGESLSGLVIDRLLEQPMSWHQKRPTGDLAARAGVDVDAATDVLTPLPFASSVVILIVVSSAWLLITDIPLGLVAVAVFPILTFVNLIYQHRVDQYFDRAQGHVGDLSAAVHESFEGVQVIKAFGAEQRETDRLALIAGKLRDERISAVKLRGTFEALLDAVPALANVGLIVLGASRIRSGNLTIGELTSTIYLFTLLVFPLRIVGYALSSLPHSLAGWRRLREVLDEAVEPDANLRIGLARPGMGVEFERVWFGYEVDRPVLSGVSVCVETGSTMALVGATGSGKSTLLRLAAGLIGADSGSIASAVGVRALVFQEPFLLAGTVRDNISMGASLSDSAIWEAIEQAEAREFVLDLPLHLDTELGERGVSLSGGQRQRLALARALARNPSVLLLDDTTSSLDPGTEARVIANLRRSLQKSTVLMVASRPSTLALADRVAFLEGGQIAATGTHAELLATHDGYRHLMVAFDVDREQADQGASERGESS